MGTALFAVVGSRNGRPPVEGGCPSWQLDIPCKACATGIGSTETWRRFFRVLYSDARQYPRWDSNPDAREGGDLIGRCVYRFHHGGLDDVGEDGALVRLRPRRVVWCGRAGVSGQKGKPGPLAHITDIASPCAGQWPPSREVREGK